MKETRHQIKTRMLRNAARAWGYPETEAESSFDPLVSMMLSACSAELEKISGEIHASRARVLERLVQLLSPDSFTGAQPAHAVACALPLDNRTILQADAQLYAHRKLSVPDSTEPAFTDVFFAPTADVTLNRASIRFMATGNQLYRINHTISKEIIAHGDNGKALAPSTLWLALDEPGRSLDGTQFYFDFRNEADKNLFYHQLPAASWWLNNKPLQALPGYGRREISGEQLDLETMLHRDYDTCGRIRKHVNMMYKSSFVTLYDDLDISGRPDEPTGLPEDIQDTFSGKELMLLQKQPLRWISIRFSETVPNRLLQDLVCIMNCFPVINTRLHSMSHRVQELVNIIPLQSEELFLDLEEVTDDEGKSLAARPVGNVDDGAFSMLMRNGGVGRFDERDAASIVDYLLQLLRDDSASFATLGTDFIGGEVKQLQQIINKLEQRLFTRQVPREQTPYLVVRNNRKFSWQNLFISFWSTNGPDGNNLKAGNTLQLYKGGSLDNNLALLVTTTQGGRNKLNTTETALAYKSALLSRDRLITPEDIKAFCYHQLGERVKSVEVNTGVRVPPGISQGFTKTIDVVVRVHKKSFEEMEETGELSFWEDNLRLQITGKSASLLPYHVSLRQSA